MSFTPITTEPRCDLIRLERTNMVTKMEDRIKVDLVAMSKLILDHLRLCDLASLAHMPEMINRIAVQFNQGALLQYQYGEIGKAETLCRGEIELFAQLSSCSTHRALCLANMVPPYINLARIYGQEGEVKESLSIFEDIYRFSLQQQDLLIFGHHIPATEGRTIFEAAPDYQRVMLSCRVVEAARVLQIIEDYPALLALVEMNEGRPEYQDGFFKQYLFEVRSRALLSLMEYEMAMDALAACCRQMPLNSTDRIVIHLLLSQIYREWGHKDLAREALNKLQEHFSAIEGFGRRLPILRQIAYRLALELYLLGDSPRAIGLAEKAFKWCSEWDDQPGSIKSAILLLRICSDRSESVYSPAMQRHWYTKLQQLASTTYFRLDRACAYWELGLSSESVEADNGRGRQSACEFLENSYILYHSIPFIDSRQSSEAVRRSLGCRAHKLSVSDSPAEGIVGLHNSSIDSVFDALMDYVPKFVVSRGDIT